MSSSRSIGWCLLAVLATACGGGGSQAPAPAVAGEMIFAAPEAVPSDGTQHANGTLRSYWQGSLLLMERREGDEASRIAIDTAWGGYIAEASLNGVNFVNAHDTGRGVQLALYDGTYRYDPCAGCTGVWGWNPVQGGDRYNHGSQVLSTAVDAQGVTVRIRPLEWMPTGTQAPVPTEVVIEQRISPVPGYLRAWRVDFRVENESMAARQVALQELPAVYAGLAYQRLVTYEGRAPWTGETVTVSTPAPLGEPPIHRHSTEHWFALVDDKGEGLALYAPGSYAGLSGFVAPGSAGPGGSGTAYARFDSPLAVQAHGAIAGHYYLVVGDLDRARSIIYALMGTDDGADVSAPRLAVDRPRSGTVVSGVINVTGWAYDNRGTAFVSMSINGVDFGPATLGVARPDVADVYADAPPDSGFGLALDTRRLTNGPHRLQVTATDAAGHRHDVEVEVDVMN
jgi:hypothetical protein